MELKQIQNALAADGGWGVVIIQNALKGGSVLIEILWVGGPTRSGVFKMWGYQIRDIRNARVCVCVCVCV